MPHWSGQQHQGGYGAGSGVDQASLSQSLQRFNQLMQQAAPGGTLDPGATFTFTPSPPGLCFLQDLRGSWTATGSWHVRINFD